MRGGVCTILYIRLPILIRKIRRPQPRAPLLASRARLSTRLNYALSVYEVRGGPIGSNADSGLAAAHKDAMKHQGPFRHNDLMIATISGLLAWMITLALRAAFGG